MSHGPINYFSMFSGIGGFELGIEQSMASINRTADGGSETSSAREQSQWERLVPEAGQASRAPTGRRGHCTANVAYTRTPACVGYSEIDKHALQIYRRHFPAHINFGDIIAIDEGALPDFDLLVGGFPCQAFSIAGLRRGFDDRRGTLFFDIARILRAKKPERFLLENVRGLLSHDDGRTFKTIIAALAELGYGVEWQVLNSKDFGVPQNRERVFIVGHLGGECRRQIFPLGADDEVFDGAESSDEGQAQASLFHTLRGPNIKADQTFVLDELTRSGTSDAQRIYDANGLGRTLKGESGGQGGKMGLYRIGARVRRLTPTECERLQGFPDGWTRLGSDGEISDTQRYKTLGNAVTVNVITAIMVELLHGNR
jgi:DNA (cytosine-5)-methyltransferase 1